MRPTTAQILLYAYATSPFAAKAHCYLLYKRLTFEVYYVNPMQARDVLPVGHQVPVLTVGSESRNESSDIGIWLDELYPNKPMLLPEEPKARQRLLDIDQWISDRLIPNTIRAIGDGRVQGLLNSWRMGNGMHRSCDGGLPLAARIMWPVVLKKQRFIRKLVAAADLSRPPAEAMELMREEFLQRLGDGPFLDSRAEPSLPDFSAFPLVTHFYRLGLAGVDTLVRDPVIRDWVARLQPHVTGEPPLLPEALHRRAVFYQA